MENKNMTPKSALEMARRKVADELFDEYMQSFQPVCRIDIERSTPHEDRVFIDYYFSGFDDEKEKQYLYKNRGSCISQDFDNFIAQLDEAWPKLNYSHFWVAYAPGTSDVLNYDSLHCDKDEASQYPELDLFCSELPQDVAEWVIDQLETGHLGSVYNRMYKYVSKAGDIKDEQIRQFFQKLEDGPHCDSCQTPLRNYENPYSQYEGFGFGCPVCCDPYCPFCFVSYRSDPRCCEHLIVDLGDAESFSERNSTSISPFDDTMFNNAIDKWYAKLGESSGNADWSMQQKETAFGPLLLSYEAFAKDDACGDYCNIIIALLEAFPAVGEIQRVSFMWENWGCQGTAYFYTKGFFCDKPEISQSYYKEQAANFVTGLNALAEMEPENMNTVE